VRLGQGRSGSVDTGCGAGRRGVMTHRSAGRQHREPGGQDQPEPGSSRPQAPGADTDPGQRCGCQSSRPPHGRMARSGCMATPTHQAGHRRDPQHGRRSSPGHAQRLVLSQLATTSTPSTVSAYSAIWPFQRAAWRLSANPSGSHGRHGPRPAIISTSEQICDRAMSGIGAGELRRRGAGSSWWWQLQRSDGR